MKRFQMAYSDIIRWRIRGWWAVIVCMIAYIITISELGGGDSRMMTDTAHRVSQLLTWGAMVWAGYRIRYNKKLLRDRERMRAQLTAERDEHARWLHDKSGGIVTDAILVVLMILTDTAAFFNMPAFYLSLTALVTAVGLKAAAYWGYKSGVLG